jgi:hypothetical protein
MCDSSQTFPTMSKIIEYYITGFFAREEIPFKDTINYFRLSLETHELPKKVFGRPENAFNLNVSFASSES